MTRNPNRLKALLRQHAAVAWEAEMRAALGSLAAKFDEWKAGRMSSDDLHAAIHEYHNGPGREIWKRFATSNPKVPLAHAVAAGLVPEESLPIEVRGEIAGMVELFRDRDQEQDT